MGALFPFGRLVARSGELAVFADAGEDPAELPARHQSQGWGDVTVGFIIIGPVGSSRASRSSCIGPVQ